MTDRPTETWTVDIGRPPDEVFGYLADMGRHGEWSPKPFRVEGLPPGPVVAGTTFTSYGWIPGDKEHRNDVEVTEVEAPARLVFRSNEKDQYFVNTFTVTPTAGGSRVERTIDIPVPKGLMGVLFPLILRLVVRPTVQKGMNMLQQNLESGRGAG